VPRGLGLLLVYGLFACLCRASAHASYIIYIRERI
jgi:hypothetical protein